MQYLLMIYGREADLNGMSQAEQEKVFGDYMAFTESIRKSGNYVGGEALHPIATATTVRVKDGKKITTDGPFAETREQLGGFYLVNAKDLDEATAIAARIPGASHGCVEVRPTVDFSQPQ